MYCKYLRLLILTEDVNFRSFCIIQTSHFRFSELFSIYDIHLQMFYYCYAALYDPKRYAHINAMCACIALTQKHTGNVIRYISFMKTSHYE